MIQGWSIQNYYKYRMLKVMLRNESERIKKENWTKLMETTAMKYEKPRDFWRLINRLKGNKTPTNQDLEVNNIKLINDKDKEAAHRAILQDVFKISPQENAEYDREKEEEVRRYLDAHQNKITPFERSNLNRLQGANQIDTLITQIEIKSVINSFKNNTPGETNINKTIFKNLPNRGLTILQTL